MSGRYLIPSWKVRGTASNLVFLRLASGLSSAHRAQKPHTSRGSGFRRRSCLPMTLRHWINKHHTCTRCRMESTTTSSPQNRIPAAIPVVPLEELPAPSEYMAKMLQKHQEFLAEQKTPEADEMIAQMWRRNPGTAPLSICRWLHAACSLNSKRSYLILSL